MLLDQVVVLCQIDVVYFAVEHGALCQRAKRYPAVAHDKLVCQVCLIVRFEFSGEDIRRIRIGELRKGTVFGLGKGPLVRDECGTCKEKNDQNKDQVDIPGLSVVRSHSQNLIIQNRKYRNGLKEASTR